MKWAGIWAALAVLGAGLSWATAADPSPAGGNLSLYPGLPERLGAIPGIPRVCEDGGGQRGGDQGGGSGQGQEGQGGGGGQGQGGQGGGSGQGRDQEDPPPLGLWNFFTAGWNEEFTRRSSEDRAPNLALLRVQTNFMERELRINYFYQNNIHSPARSNIDNLDYFIAYAFNRRFMLEAFGNYQWVEGRGKNPDESGAAPQFVGRVQLISTAVDSYSFNFRVISPNRGLGEHQTTFSYGLAGFEDLTYRLGLYRVGLYYSALFDTYAGPGAPGARHNDVQYDVTLAKTLTPPDTPLIGNFTVFVENFAQTDLDGVNSGHTVATITPGVRFNLGKLPGIKLGIDNWLMGGVDIPVSGPKPWDATYRFTYIKNF